MRGRKSVVEKLGNLENAIPYLRGDPRNKEFIQPHYLSNAFFRK